MFSNCINFKKQGDMGMCYAIAYYSKLGWTISIPVTDSQDYDLIVDTGTKLLKVQVKTTSQISDHGIYIVSLKTCGGNKSGYTIKTFENNQSDLLFVLTSHGDCYSIPRDAITSKSTISLGEKVLMYKVSLF